MKTGAKTLKTGVHEAKMLFPPIPLMLKRFPSELGNWGWVWEAGGMRTVSYSLCEVLLENQSWDCDQVTRINYLI